MPPPNSHPKNKTVLDQHLPSTSPHRRSPHLAFSATPACYIWWGLFPSVTLFLFLTIYNLSQLSQSPSHPWNSWCTGSFATPPPPPSASSPTIDTLQGNSVFYLRKRMGGGGGGAATRGLGGATTFHLPDLFNAFQFAHYFLLICHAFHFQFHVPKNVQHTHPGIQ